MNVTITLTKEQFRALINMAERGAEDLDTYVHEYPDEYDQESLEAIEEDIRLTGEAVSLIASELRLEPVA